MLLIQSRWSRAFHTIMGFLLPVLCSLRLVVCQLAATIDDSVLLQTNLNVSTGVGEEEAAGTSPAAKSAQARRRLETALSASAVVARARALARPVRIDSDEPYRQVMVNFGDAQYIGYFTIGRQLVGGIIDTGSYELVVFSSVCGSCGAAAEYNPWLSSSYNMGLLKTTHSYGSGDTYSQQAADLVSIGPFPDTKQYFWEVTKATMPILYSAAFQAIIGIGPPETPAADAWEATAKTAANVSQGLNASGHVPSDVLEKVSENLEVALELSAKTPLLQTFNVSMFSLCVGKRPGSDGFFVWNDNSAYIHTNIFKRVSVIGRHSWSVWLSNVRISGVDQDGSNHGNSTYHLGCTEGCSAIIDSGTSLLAVPSFIKNKLESLMSRMNGDCSNLQEFPDLIFDMDGHTFSLPPDAYVAEVVGTLPNYLTDYVNVRPRQFPFEPRTRCQLLLMESYASTRYGPLWILGVPFFRKYYTSFRIGESRSERSLYIAPASKDCTPATNQAVLLGRASHPHVRTSGTPDIDIPLVDASKINLPAIARHAAKQKFVNL